MARNIYGTNTYLVYDIRTQQNKLHYFMCEINVLKTVYKKYTCIEIEQFVFATTSRR